MTVLAFVFFVFVYRIVTSVFLLPMYGRGPLFAIPFVVLLLLTLGTWYGVLSRGLASVLTGLLSVLFICGALFLFTVLLWEGGTVQIEAPAQYDRAFRRTSVGTYCPDLLPHTIPQDAVFYYTPQFLQGGEVFALSFIADDATLSAYEAIVAANALWSGSCFQAKSEDRNVLYPYGLDGLFEYDILPDSYILYQIAASPECGRGHNHAMSYTVTLNRETGEIFFHYSRW